MQCRSIPRRPRSSATSALANLAKRATSLEIVRAVDAAYRSLHQTPNARVTTRIGSASWASPGSPRSSTTRRLPASLVVDVLAQGHALERLEVGKRSDLQLTNALTRQVH